MFTCIKSWNEHVQLSNKYLMFYRAYGKGEVLCIYINIQYCKFILMHLLSMWIKNDINKRICLLIVLIETSQVDKKSYILTKSMYMWKDAKLCKSRSHFIIFEYEKYNLNQKKYIRF